MNETLTTETASNYIVMEHQLDHNDVGFPCNVLSAKAKNVDGIDVVEVRFAFRGHVFSADVWVETRQDGSQFIYGEW